MISPMGRPAQYRDFIQFYGLCREYDLFGMPVIACAHPRGSTVEAAATLFGTEVEVRRRSAAIDGTP